MSSETHVNNSGFPLQIGLAKKIEASNLGWKVLYEEHSWQNESGAGFIDLVLEDRYKTLLMNIECKRVRDTSWIFLVPSTNQKKMRLSKLWISHRSGGEWKCFNWVDIQIEPDSYQSKYCVVPGQDPKARPMLERTAASVVSSTEALAVEEAKAISEKYSSVRMYINVIVTTADLKVCNFEPDRIDLINGEVENGSFEDVPFIRFRKQLSFDSPEAAELPSEDPIRGLVSQKENTVFIVQASEFINFLSQLELPDNINSIIKNC